MPSCFLLLSYKTTRLTNMLRRLNTLKKFNNIRVRNFNSATAPTPTYQTSILPNGLTVASESMPELEQQPLEFGLMLVLELITLKVVVLPISWNIWLSKEPKEEHSQI